MTDTVALITVDDLTADDPATKPGSVEVVDPNSTRALYEEARSELHVADREAAKAVLVEAMQEVERLQTLLAKAEDRLKALLDKDVSDLAMMTTTDMMMRGITLSDPRRAIRSF